MDSVLVLTSQTAVVSDVRVQDGSDLARYIRLGVAVL